MCAKNATHSNAPGDVSPLSMGVVIGIVVGVLFGVIFCIGAFAYLLCMRKPAAPHVAVTVQVRQLFYKK